MKKKYYYIFGLIIFVLQKLIKQKDNYITFYSQFDTHKNIIQMIDHQNYKCVVLKKNKMHIISQIYFIIRSKYIVIDNVYTPLYDINTEKKVILQLWHAPGAVKKFGLNRMDIQSGKQKNINFYRSVYQKVDYVTVGSDHMYEVMQKSLGMDEKKILKLGYPKMYFYESSDYWIKSNALKSMFKKPKNILYIPTFRTSDTDNQKQVEFLKYITANLPSEYDIFYKMHAHNHDLYKDGNKISDKHLIYVYPYFDVIITDYSSIIFEAARFNPNFIFYCYDYEKYTQKQGVYLDENQLPGPIIKEQELVLKEILESTDQNHAIDFFNKHNQYHKQGNMKLLVDTFLNK